FAAPAANVNYIPVIPVMPVMRETQALLRDARRLIAASRESATATFDSLDRTRKLIRESRRILGHEEGNAMDRALSLDQAEEHIAEGERHIRHQREIIDRLERGGHDTAFAKELLENLEVAQARHVKAREQLLK